MKGIRLARAELRRASNRTVVKSGEASAIAKEYLSFSLPRKQQFYVSYQGERYMNEDVRRLLDELQPE
jgi:hypothetical protein